MGAGRSWPSFQTLPKEISREKGHGVHPQVEEPQLGL